MSTFWILLEQMELFVIYILAGVILVKSRLFNRETLQPISKFVLRMGLPLLIFTNIINGVERNVLLSSGSVLMSAFLFYVAMFFISMGIARIFHVKGKTAQIYQTMKLVNPASIGIIVALFMILTGLKLPTLLNTGLQKIGSTATPLAMIYLGGIFACVPMKNGLRRGELYGIVFAKMLLVPMIMYGMMGAFGIAGDVRLTIALIAGMPVMASIAMMVTPSDSEYAMGGIFITTICSLVTLPLVCLILQ